MSKSQIGVFLVLTAGLCGSLAGLLVRLVDSADGWQVLFYRSVSFAVLVFLFMLAQNRKGLFKRFTDIGIWGVIVAIFLGSAFIAYIFSLLLTTVANAVFILSASPFIAALLAKFLLNESVSTRAWFCMAAALTGVAIMLADGLLTGTLIGSAVAFVAAFGYALSVVAFRAGKDIDMMPATCLAGVFAAFVCLFLVDEFAISRNDLTVAILLGTLQIGLQYILVTIAARFVPAAQVTILMMIEVVAAPIWVWLAFGEVPAVLTLIGGAIVLAAVVLQATEEQKAQS